MKLTIPTAGPQEATQQAIRGRHARAGRSAPAEGRGSRSPDAIRASQPTGNARKTPWLRVNAASPPRTAASSQDRSRAATIVQTDRARNSDSVNGANRK